MDVSDILPLCPQSKSASEEFTNNPELVRNNTPLELSNLSSLKISCNEDIFNNKSNQNVKSHSEGNEEIFLECSNKENCDKHPNAELLLKTQPNNINPIQNPSFISTSNSASTNLLSSPEIRNPQQFQTRHEEPTRSENTSNTHDNDENQRLQQLIKDMGRFKAAFYFRHSMAFFAAFLFLARYSVELIDRGSYVKEVFVVLYTYLCYAFLEEINFYLRYKTTDNDTKIHYIYTGLDVFSLICSLGIIHLKYLGIFPPAKAAALPGLVICALFYLSPYQRKGAKTLFLIKRLLETMQIYLVEIKLEGGLVDLPWKSLLAYTWIYIGVRILLLLASLKTMKMLVPQNSKRAALILIVWHYFYIILLLTVLLIYIGYSMAFDSNGDFDFLRRCLVGSQYFSASLFMLTLLTKPLLVMVFSRVSVMDYQSSEFGEVILDPLSVGVSKKVEVEDKNIYFSMLSSTYYQQIKKGILGIKGLKSKKLERSSTPYRLKTSQKDLHINTSLPFQIKKDSPKIKRMVPKRNVPQDDFLKTNTVPLNNKQIPPYDFSDYHSSALHIQRRRSELYLNTCSSATLLDHKSTNALSLYSPARNMTKGNLYNYHNETQNKNKNIFNFNSQDSDQEALCYVCFKAPADGIVMECGHGGVCYDCTMKYMLLKNQCMSCRGYAGKVARIRVKPVFDNIFKGYMTAKMVTDVDDNRCKWFLD